MIPIRVDVETTELAEKVSTVTRHVNLTTGAVVAMQSAVIQAEGEAAELVCENVNRGFYVLIRSQISQKIARLQSDVDAHLMQLMQYKGALHNIRLRMENDYHMIADRYKKLFNSLNGSLRQRVFELDKPTIDFAVKEVDRLYNRMQYLPGIIPIAQLESLTTSQSIIASNAKHRCSMLVYSMNSFLQEIYKQNILKNQVMIKHHLDKEITMYYAPVIVCDNRRDIHSVLSVCIPSQVLLKSSTKSALSDAILHESTSFVWKEKGKPSKEIAKEFTNILSTSTKSERIKKLIQNMYTSSEYYTLG